MLAPGTIALEWTHQRSAIPSSLKEETFQTSLYLYCQAGNDFNFGSVIQQTQLVYRPPNDQYYNDKSVSPNFHCRWRSLTTYYQMVLY